MHDFGKMAKVGPECGDFTTKRIVHPMGVQILSLRPPAEVRFFRSHQNTFKNKFLKRLERIKKCLKIKLIESS